MKNKIDKFVDKDEWKDYVGKEIEKHSGKPFKNGEKTNIVKGFGINPYSGKPGFVVEDDSIVDCYQCKLVN